MELSIVNKWTLTPSVALVWLLTAISTAGAEDPSYLGEPLSHWVAQAKRPGGPEDAARTIKALAEALESEAPEVRVKAADALGAFGPAAAPAAEALAGQLGHQSPWVRVAAMETLDGMGAAAVPALVKNLETGDRAVCIRSCLVLAGIGPDAKGAVPVLKKRLDDPRPGVAERAAQALAAIEATAGSDPAPGDGPPDRVGTVVRATPAEPGEVVPRDWPCFHGPRRDAMCRETGLLQKWPEGGPPLLWKLEGLGRGFSTVSIAGGRLFTMGDRRAPEGTERQYVLAYDLDTREELWAAPIGPPHDDGPRCTPTLDGELLYALGTVGDLVCLEAATGKPRWHKSFADDFGGQMMSVWKYSESPLVDGEKLVCTPGGPDATIVALDKLSGETIWKCAVPEIGPSGKDGAAYASMVVAEVAGVRQYVQLVGRGVVGVEAATGRFLWGYNRIANTVANIPTPIVSGGHVFCSTAYGTGSALLKITRDGEQFDVEEVYFLDAGDFQNHHGGMVLVDGYVYGGSGGNRGVPVCIEVATGKIAWSEKPPERGSAAVLYADGHVLFRYDRGLVVWVEATPEAFRIDGTLEPETADNPAWPHPVIHRGKLYLRHNDLLLCYDLRAER